MKEDDGSESEIRKVDVAGSDRERQYTHMSSTKTGCIFSPGRKSISSDQQFCYSRACVMHARHADPLAVLI